MNVNLYRRIGDTVPALVVETENLLLSEAIRKGAGIVAGQNSYALLLDKSLGKGEALVPANCTACALGAAMIGYAGFDTAWEVYSKHGAIWMTTVIQDSCNDITSIMAQHPVKGTWESVQGIIASLNDFHDWSFNQIADWVATVEIELGQNLPPEE